MVAALRQRISRVLGAGPGPSRGGRRLAELDGLRGLAAVAVVTFHFGYQAPSLFPDIGTPIQFLFPAREGVELFFVISGFVILMTLERSSVRAFIASRISRLYPAYWVAVAVTFAVVMAAGLPGVQVSLRDALLNLTMLQTYLGAQNVDGVYWTLAVELAFYVQAALLWYLGALRGRKLIWTLIAWLIAAGAVTMLEHRHPTGHWFIDNAVGPAFSFIPFFVAGIAVLQVYRTGDRKMIWVLLCAAVSIAVTSGVTNAPPYGIVYAVLVLLVLKGRVPWGGVVRVRSRRRRRGRATV